MVVKKFLPIYSKEIREEDLEGHGKKTETYMKKHEIKKIIKGMLRIGR